MPGDESCQDDIDLFDAMEDVQSRYFGIRRMELVPVLEGFSGKDGSGSSSVTLVRTPTTVLAVDSGSSTERGRIKTKIARSGIRPERVNVLVSTELDHFHSGNDDLFPHALQHLKEGDRSKAPFKSGRKVEISTSIHWIDKYLMLRKLDAAMGGNLAVIVHFPNPLELLTPESRHLAGLKVGITGAAVRSQKEGVVVKALEEVRKARASGAHASKDISDLTGLLSYCDMIVPEVGPIFTTG